MSTTSAVTSTTTPVAVLADKINAEHVHAQRDATNAIAHAVRCGELLLSVKASLKHGEFLPWVEKNCVFTHRTATAYMRGGRQIGSGLPISSLSSLFGPLDEKVVLADDADPEPKPPAKITLPAPMIAKAAPGLGMQFARMATMDLRQIAPDDSEREEAFATVKRWIADAEAAP